MPYKYAAISNNTGIMGLQSEKKSSSKKAKKK